MIKVRVVSVEGMSWDFADDVLGEVFTYLRLTFLEGRLYAVVRDDRNITFNLPESCLEVVQEQLT